MVEVRFEEASRRHRLALGARLALAGLLLAGVANHGATPCAAADRAPAGMTLELDAPENWQRFEVRRDGLRKRVEFRDLATPEIRRMRYRGLPNSWMSPLNLIVDADIYERRSHRVAYRFVEPWSGRDLVLRASSKSQRLHGVALPLGSDNVEVELSTRGEDEPFGHLSFDPKGPVLFSGAIDGRPIRIETLAGQPVPTGAAREVLLGAYPLAGVFRIRSSEHELVRFVQLAQEGAASRYELAMARELAAEARYDAWLTFIVFDLMKEFVHSAS